MFRSATFKLTLWYLAIIVVISLAFSTVAYHFGTGELGMGLSHQTQRLYRDFPVFTGNPYLRPGRDLQAGSHHILIRLLWFNLVVILLGGGASYLLARRTLRPIEAAHERQQRFTADVSHELRTPLTSLRMNSEVGLMDAQASTADLRSTLESNLEDVSKMELLINNLLRLTRLDTEAAQANYSLHDVSSLITAAVEQVASKASAKGMTITTPPAADATVYGDFDGLLQLLIILLDNAIKYSPEQSTISISLPNPRPLQTEIVIRDEGQGIAPEALPHVFDRFYRADSSRSSQSAEGFGLGLSIAKLIADRHNGSITLASRPGKGTTANLSLPSTAPGK